MRTKRDEMPGLRWGRALLVLAIVASIALPLPFALAEASTSGSDVVFHDAFESGNLDQWSAIAGFTLAAGADNGHVLRGLAGLSAEVATATFRNDSPDTYLFVRLKLRKSPASGSALIGALDDAQRSIAAVGIDDDGFVTLTLDSNGQTLTSHTPITSGVWHTLQMHVVADGSAIHIEVWFDGIYLTSL